MVATSRTPTRTPARPIAGRPSTGAARAALVALVPVLVLAGCGQEAPGSDDATTAPAVTTAPPSPPTTPTTTPTPTATPDLLDTSGDVAQAGTSTLTAPLSGSTVPGPTVTVSGTGTAFEATMVWDVHPAGDLTSAVVYQGSTTAGSNGEVGPFTFTVDLPPGTWTVRVWEPDMKEGDTSPGATSHLVSATFRVA